MLKHLRWTLAAFFLLACGAPALGQDVHVFWQNAPGSGFNQWAPVSATNPLPVSASASISGFNPTTTGTPISVTTGGVTGTLPSGAVVVASNVGTTNVAYCKLGASATTSDQPIAPNGGWFAFTVAAATQLTCITSTSTTTVNMVGGTGLPTGTGGGGGGSGGGDASAANQTNGDQKTQIVDGSGNVIASTSNALNVAVTNVNANGQATMANSSPVVIASNQSDVGVSVNNANSNGQATSANSSPVVLASDQTVPDACTFAAKTNLPISFQTTSITQLVAASGSTKIYICSLSLVASAATVFSLVGGTGSNCGTPAALIGTTSATHGLSLAANGGLTLGNGAGTVAVTAASSEVCIVQSGAGDLVGNLTYIQK